MVKDSEIKRLAAVLEDKEKVNAIGSKILVAAIQQAAEEKAGLGMGDSMVKVSIKKGDTIPDDLKGTILEDASGKAAENWNKGWTNLIVWKKEYSEHKHIEHKVTEEDKITTPTDFINSANFTSEEMKILKDLNMLKEK